MIVFGVCALGVGSLYLVPAIARSPEQIRHSGANEEATNGTVGIGPTQPEPSSSTTGDSDPVPGVDGDPATTAPGAQLLKPTTTRAKDRSDTTDDRSSDKARAGEPKANKDSEPPEPVADIEPSKVTAKQLTINWPAADDNVGVIGYRIWLNGFEVATTAKTKARLHWFNDDSGQHVVQIRALDAAGNQSPSSPTLVVTRPSPEPTDSPTPEPSDSPTPSDESSESSHGTDRSSGPANDKPTDEKPPADEEDR